MSFYEPQGWQAPARQSSWEQPPPPSRSGASSSSQREDGTAFAIQFEEIDRAIDNLVKSGKLYQAGPRRDSIPVMMSPGRPYHDYSQGHRLHGSRHSVSDFDPSHSVPAANRQNFYATQRYQGHQGPQGHQGHPGHPGRHSDVDPAFAAKKRMAQARERELRNYHQEQQYNRSLLAEMSSNKSDRSMSPSTMSEEGRRDLLARQHRALYGNEAPSFIPHAGDPAAGGQGPVGPGARGSSPRGMEPFGLPGQGGPAADVTGQGASQEPGREKAASPAGPPPTAFGTFEGTTAKTCTPPVGDETAHTRQLSKSTTAPIAGSMGPIGSRSNTQQPPNQGIKQRTTSPLPPSMSYGFNASEQTNERSTSSNSNSGAAKENAPNPALGAWGTGSGVWGSNKIGATSVWE